MENITPLDTMKRQSVFSTLRGPKKAVGYKRPGFQGVGPMNSSAAPTIPGNRVPTPGAPTQTSLTFHQGAVNDYIKNNHRLINSSIDLSKLGGSIGTPDLRPPVSSSPFTPALLSSVTPAQGLFKPSPIMPSPGVPVAPTPFQKYPATPTPPQLVGAPAGTPPPIEPLPQGAIGWFWYNGKWNPNYQYSIPEQPPRSFGGMPVGYKGPMK